MIFANIWTPLFWCVGLLTSLTAYESLAPFVAALISLFAIYPLLHFTPAGGLWERHLFYRLFAIGVAIIGVTGIYAEVFFDEQQLTRDAYNFYLLSTSADSTESLDELRSISEGALAIVIWKSFYNIYYAVGFEKLRYIGLILNIIAVSFSGLISIKLAKLIYGTDVYRLRRLSILFSSCGLFWMFMGIHLRDSFILLVNSLFFYMWVLYLTRPKLLILLNVFLFTIIGVIFYGFFRAEFSFVPIAFAVAGSVTILWKKFVLRHKSLSLYVPLIISILIFIWVSYWDDIQLALQAGSEGYKEIASESHDHSSLGMRLIVNQPMLIRMLLGSIYLFIYPIPIWSGFQMHSAYHLFGSINAIFYYFLLTLLVLSIISFFSKSKEKESFEIFLWLCTIGFILSIVGTSLEQRHWGVFLIGPMVLALGPDLRVQSLKLRYRTFFKILIINIFAIHVLWAILNIL